MKSKANPEAEDEIKANPKAVVKSKADLKDSTLTEITAEAAVADEETDKAKAVLNSINMFKSYIPKE